MPRDTFVLTQDIADEQLIDSHLKPGSRLRSIVDKSVLNFLFLQNIVITGPTLSIRLDLALTGKTPAVGPGNGVELALRHAIFQGGTNKGVLDGSSNDVNGLMTYDAALTFAINMTNSSATGTTVGDPGDVQIGDTVTIPTPVPFTATITNKVPNGPNYDLTFSTPFVTGATGPYTATRIPRWTLAFKDSLNAPFNMPAQTLDLGITQRSYMSEVLESFALGLHPHLIPQAGGGGGGGGGDIKSDGTVPFAADESMGGFKLINVGPPTAGGDAANKNYVDVLEALDIRRDGSRAFTGSQSMGGFALTNVQDPINPQDAATKNYVDDHDKYAATFIVNSDPDRGHFTTIEAAVAAVPVGGADIYVMAGTFAPLASIPLPIDRDVRIRGAGRGITNVTMPTGVPLFTVAGGATAHYELWGTKLTGDNTASQSLKSLTSSIDFLVVDCEIVDLRDIVVTTVQPEVNFVRCKITFTSVATTCSFWRGTSGGKMTWTYVEASFATQSTDGILGNPDWSVTDSYIGGGGTLTTSCNVGKMTVQGLKTDKIHIFANSPGGRVVNLEQIDGNITVQNARMTIVSSTFTTPTLSGSQLSVVGQGVVDIAIAACVFDGGGNNNVAVDVSDSQGVVVTGCAFRNNGAGSATDAAIHVGATGGSTEITVVGCRFSGTIGGAQVTNAVYEFFGLGTITGRYSDNVGFQTSVVGSLTSTVDGRRQFNGTGSTVDALTGLFTHTSPFGLGGSGTIKNTGGSNTLTIRRTVTDQFGVTDFQEDPVLPGMSATWNFDVVIGTAGAPYKTFTLSIKSTTPGQPTTYSVRASSTGAY